jgi:hypothetical protein
MLKAHTGEIRNIKDQKKFSRQAARKGDNLGDWKLM